MASMFTDGLIAALANEFNLTPERVRAAAASVEAEAKSPDPEIRIAKPLVVLRHRLAHLAAAPASGGGGFASQERRTAEARRIEWGERGDDTQLAARCVAQVHRMVDIAAANEGRNPNS